MRRRLYKYIFVFNIVVIFSLVIVIFVMGERNAREREIRASITTPLLSSDTLDVSFCHNSTAAVLIDAKSGAVLYSKNADKKLPMASTTKIMTALVVLENSSPDDIVKVSQNAAGVEGSSIYLEEGEMVSVNDLLYGLLLESGNDAATALAEGVFGSVENCCRVMNERAKSMGLVNTNFTNPHGLDDENHYTTAYELSLIAKSAMKNELFKRIVSTKSYVTAGEKVRYFSNHNRLLKSFDGAVGVKTGYTSRSGRCLVSAAVRDDEEYIAVTLNDSNDWNDHKMMYAFGFDNFGSYEIACPENFTLYAGFSRYTANDDVYITVSGESDFTLDYKISVGKELGRVEYLTDGTSLGRFDITAVEFQ